jgi:hypothetical protein
MPRSTINTHNNNISTHIDQPQRVRAFYQRADYLSLDFERLFDEVGLVQLFGAAAAA